VIRETLELAPFLNDAGVPLLVGSDNLGLQVSGFSVHAEMQKLQQAGIPVYDVLKAGTVNSARFLKRFATAGTINEGKNAEFLILAQNPLEEISHTESIVGVILKGQWYDRQALDKM
jgi:imidazolonepropionase-like amidohydrolase